MALQTADGAGYEEKEAAPNAVAAAAAEDQEVPMKVLGCIPQVIEGDPNEQLQSLSVCPSISDLSNTNLYTFFEGRNVRDLMMAQFNQLIHCHF